MSAELLAEAMGATVPLQRYRELLPAVQACLRDSQATTTDRIAMWCAQIGHESAGLKYMEELASGDAYEGRTDLGNTQPGDGRRYKGRGPIQITGRTNYTQCSRWAFERGLVPTPTFFADHPAEMASDRYGFIGTTWYWVSARPQLNEAADRGDLIWATKLINGGTNGLEDRRTRYNRALAIGQRLLELTKQGGDAVTAVVIDYDRSIRPQITGWSCGPASAEIVLNGKGIHVAEEQLIKDIGTTTNGTDYVGLIVDRALKKYAPEAQYKAVYLEKDPCTAEQKAALWDHLVHSISNGWGVVANIVVPPWNRPKSVPPSTQDLQYPNAWVWHYIAVMSVDPDPAMRKVWLADSGFAPGGAWISFDQLATLIPPKGYAWASAPGKPSTPKPQPPQSEQSKIDTIFHEVTQRLAGRTLDDPELREFITDPHRRDTVLGWAMNAAALGRINYEILKRLSEATEVDISDIR